MDLVHDGGRVLKVEGNPIDEVGEHVLAFCGSITSSSPPMVKDAKEMEESQEEHGKGRPKDSKHYHQAKVENLDQWMYDMYKHLPPRLGRRGGHFCFSRWRENKRERMRKGEEADKDKGEKNVGG
jgi:hypothetical protein